MSSADERARKPLTIAGQEVSDLLVEGVRNDTCELISIADRRHGPFEDDGGNMGRLQLL